MEPSFDSRPTGARAFFTPRWIVTTVLVIAAAVVTARLGFWQLDRLEQRRTFNSAVLAQIDAPPLDLNSAPSGGLEVMEYRRAAVTGVYDPAGEVVLRNQIYQNQPGYYLLTPLRIEGRDEAVLVNRGFIPLDQADPQSRAAFAEPGPVTLRGVLRLGHVPRIFGAPDPTLAPGETRLDAWNAVNLERIAAQLPYPLLPVVLELAPPAGAALSAAAAPAGALAFPAPVYVQPEISEGSHLSYAFQWFSFAALLAVGYPFFVRKQLGRQPRHKKTARSGSPGGAQSDTHGSRSDADPSVGSQPHAKEER